MAPMEHESQAGTSSRIGEVAWEMSPNALTDITEIHWEHPAGTLTRVWRKNGGLNSAPLAFCPWRGGWAVLQDANLPSYRSGDTNDNPEGFYPNGIYRFNSNGDRVGRIIGAIDDGPAGLAVLGSGELAVARGTTWNSFGATLLGRYTVDDDGVVTDYTTLLPNNMPWWELQGVNPGSQTFRSSSVQSADSWTSTSIIVSVASRETNFNDDRYNRDSVYTIDMYTGDATRLARKPRPSSRSPGPFYRGVAGDGTNWWYSNEQHIVSSDGSTRVPLTVGGVPRLILDLSYESANRIWAMYYGGVSGHSIPALAAFNPTTEMFEPDDFQSLRI